MVDPTPRIEKTVHLTGSVVIFTCIAALTLSFMAGWACRWLIRG